MPSFTDHITFYILKLEFLNYVFTIQVGVFSFFNEFFFYFVTKIKQQQQIENDKKILLIIVFNTMIFTTIIIASILYFVLFCGFLYFIEKFHHNAWRFPGIYNMCVKIFVWFPGNAVFLGERPAIIAPPESEWYHGRLDRYSAESRLRGSSKLGSYLGKC